MLVANRGIQFDRAQQHWLAHRKSADCSALDLHRGRQGSFETIDERHINGVVGIHDAVSHVRMVIDPVGTLVRRATVLVT